MRAEVIAVGTEILLGQIVNSDARFLSEELASLGIDVYYHTVVGDNRDRVEEAFAAARARSELIIFTGGLGPTADDLTKETVAEALGLELKLDQAWLEKLKGFYASLNRPMPPQNVKQALIPRGARLLYNDNGTAPGVYIEKAPWTVILLPGPPRELIPMFRDRVSPLLREKAGSVTIRSRVVKIIGMGESAVEEQVADLVQQQNPTVAPLAHNFEVHLRITAKGSSEEETRALISRVDEELGRRLGPYIYGRDQDTLEKVVGRLLAAGGMTLAVAESCTGGRLADLITNVPGSSRYFLGGVAAYSNEVKEKVLGVEKALLEAEGAVSRGVAEAMASGVRRLLGADYGIGVTGVAGPDGGTAAKPVGLVCLALAGEGFCRSREIFFPGKREAVKGRSAAAALNLLRQELLEGV